MPAFDAYAGELNQVWTNLIDNAIDAMDGQGRCDCRRVVDGDCVIVDITDSGHGMPADVQARASNRSSPPRTSARAPGWASTSPAGSSSNVTAARSPSTQSRATTAHVRLPIAR